MGASLIVVTPTGEYFPDKLINIGANRWSFKPEIGLTWPRGKRNLELTCGVWLFVDNDDFFGGVVREQDALTSFQANASYTFRPRLWLSAGWTHYTGGRTTVDSVRKSDWQDNDRYGLTLSIPLSTRQSLKFAASQGATDPNRVRLRQLRHQLADRLVLDTPVLASTVIEMLAM